MWQQLFKMLFKNDWSRRGLCTKSRVLLKIQYCNILSLHCLYLKGLILLFINNVQVGISIMASLNAEVIIIWKIIISQYTSWTEYLDSTFCARSILFNCLRLLINCGMSPCLLKVRHFSKHRIADSSGVLSCRAAKVSMVSMSLCRLSGSRGGAKGRRSYSRFQSRPICMATYLQASSSCAKEIWTMGYSSL